MIARPPRALWLLGVVLAALVLGGACKKHRPAQAPSPPNGAVELLDGGRMPRRPLRMALSLGVRQRTTIRLEVSASAGGVRQALPALTGTMLTTQTPSNNPGETNVALRFEKGELSAPEGTMPSAGLEKMQAGVARLDGLEGRLTLSDRGLPKGAQLNLESLPPEVRPMAQQFSSTLEAAMVPLPEEPVGPGAKWRQRARRNLQGVEADDVTTYELVEDDGAVLRVRKTGAQSAAPQELHLPDGRSARLVKFASTLSGSIVLNLARAQPVSMDVSAEVTTGVLEPGAAQAVELTMAMKAITTAVDVP